MAPEFARDPQAERLLEEMALRVAGEAALASEWRAAWQAWPTASAGDPRAALRFREWFLLERSSPSLGAPPAAAWSPARLGAEDEDPWTRLLGSAFGIFRSLDEGDDGLLLRELWSGREIRVSGAGLQPGDLIFARALPELEGSCALLPGWRHSRGEELAEALVADLAAARAVAPRARLSQAEVERLWFADREAPPAPDPEFSLRKLEELLAGVPGWSAERALAVLEEEGAGPLLDRLAFETRIPLEPLRLWLAQLREHGGGPEPEGQEREMVERPAAMKPCDPSRIRSALEAYDRERAGGGDLRGAWAQLVEALELEDEGAEAEAPWKSEDRTVTGPPRLPGLAFWVEVWAWEREHAGAAPSTGELATASAFAAFVEELHEGPTDAAEISAGDVWAFLARSRDVPDLEARQREILPFLDWLRSEQDATLPLEELRSGASPSWGRLRASVAFHAGQAASPARKQGIVRLRRTDPPKVLTEDGDEAPVTGLTTEVRRWLREGDALTGSWQSGSFRAEGWFPAGLAGASPPALDGQD